MSDREELGNAAHAEAPGPPETLEGMGGILGGEAEETLDSPVKRVPRPPRVPSCISPPQQWFTKPVPWDTAFQGGEKNVIVRPTSERWRETARFLQSLNARRRARGSERSCWARAVFHIGPPDIFPVC